MNSLEDSTPRTIFDQLKIKHWSAIITFLVAILGFAFGLGFKLKKYKLEAEIYDLKIKIEDYKKKYISLSDSLKQSKMYISPNKVDKQEAKDNKNDIVVEGSVNNLIHSKGDITIDNK